MNPTVNKTSYSSSSFFVSILSFLDIQSHFQHAQFILSLSLHVLIIEFHSHFALSCL
jgi:hypothetical protein